MSVSLQLLAQAGLSAHSRLIDVGAGASTLVDDLLDRGLRDISVVDVSAEALALARRRLGERADRVTWYAGDILELALPGGSFDLWHDRAVLHFLTDPEDAARYAHINPHEAYVMTPDPPVPNLLQRLRAQQRQPAWNGAPAEPADPRTATPAAEPPTNAAVATCDQSDISDQSPPSTVMPMSPAATNRTERERARLARLEASRVASGANRERMAARRARPTQP